MSEGVAAPFEADIAARVWDAKYRLRGADNGDAGVEDTWRRVAASLAAPEGPGRGYWQAAFYAALEDFRFLPGGRIQAGAGTGRSVTLFNCFVMGTIEDSLDGIFDALKEGALTMQQGGGVGYDFSTLRPGGSEAHRVGTVASGPVSFMRVWDAMCGTILSTGARRGAMMATLRCDHPDIETFIAAKRQPGELTHFNLSVLVSDAFMDAVARGAEWPLVFPADAEAQGGGDTVMRVWPGAEGERPCRVMRRVGARELWERIMRSTYEYAEPGVIFIDRVRRADNLGYCETISATNPCGELPLPPYGACDLGSINLARFVREPFTPRAAFDLDGIAATAAVAARMLDNVYEVSRFPLERQRATAHASRRIGLGITGLGDALIMLGVRYGSPDSFETAARAMRAVCLAAYRTSVAIAREKGAFPQFSAADYAAAEFVRALPADLVQDIRRHGIRNSHLTSIAPAGTISLLANNVSSGLEPVYAADSRRQVRLADGEVQTLPVTDYACALYRRMHGGRGLPPAYVSAEAVEPEAHLGMQAALQPWIDNAISKTINVPRDYGFAAFRSIYERAHALGLKGCTTYRPNPVTGAVLTAESQSQCCSIEREAD